MKHTRLDSIHVTMAGLTVLTALGPEVSAQLTPGQVVDRAVQADAKRFLADPVLETGNIFPWDCPFSLRHENSCITLVSGKGLRSTSDGRENAV